MKGQKHAQHSMSIGSILALTLTALVLIGFFSLYHRLTGTVDIRVDARQLAVAIDDSFSQISDTVAGQIRVNADKPQNPPQLPQYATAAASAVTTLAPVAAVTAAPAPTDTPMPIMSFSLCALGSLRINSDIQKAMRDDFSMLFDQLGPALQSDLTIATLDDTVITSAKTSNTNLPLEAVAAMRQAGIDVLSVGHYDTLNGGIAGLAETKKNIISAGILPYGAYASEAERSQITTYNAQGISVALLSYQDAVNDTGSSRTKKAERKFALAPLKIEEISQDIQRARVEGAQVVIVSLCWGRTSDTEPSGSQLALAQKIADAGADILLGTHPYALEPIAILEGERGDGLPHPMLCAYSLGCFTNHDRSKRTGLASLILNVTVRYNPIQHTLSFEELRYTPVYSWRDTIEGAMRYRTLLNNGQYPDFVSKSQKDVMEKCRKIVEDKMADSPISLAQ